jgi:hypothetical protein
MTCLVVPIELDAAEMAGCGVYCDLVVFPKGGCEMSEVIGVTGFDEEVVDHESENDGVFGVLE